MGGGADDSLKRVPSLKTKVKKKIHTALKNVFTFEGIHRTPLAWDGGFFFLGSGLLTGSLIGFVLRSFQTGGSTSHLLGTSGLFVRRPSNVGVWEFRRSNH
jgi:hypothetical protein